MASSVAPSVSTATTVKVVKEADYYLNPTELFRWINYRRWDGAKSRAQSHPDECCTWIVSRHSTDGRILWRHLPLHLICMQKEAACGVQEEGDVQEVVASRQMEQLMDVLLDSYPEGASSPDDQGMLPLHLLLSKAEGEPNERVINLLLSSFPNAVDVRDKFGRTPYDILREACGGAGGADDATSDGASDRCRAAFRALKRARFVADRITSTIRDESAHMVAAVQHEATNERGASQKIIVRLEEELSKARKEMDVRDKRERALQEDLRRVTGDLENVESKKGDANRNLGVTRKERDELLANNERMQAQLDEHHEVVERIRKEAEQSRHGDLEIMSNLKSEVNTSKAMTEALESQLRSRFTNEEYLTSSVADLEEQLEELKSQHDHATKKNQHEMDSILADNKKIKFTSDELAKKNAQLHDKLKDLSKQMSQVISSYSTLNTEHDRLMELAQTYEDGLLDAVRSERANLVDQFNKQRDALEKSFLEQERVIEASLQTQDALVATAKGDRARGKVTFDKLRSEFQQLRAAAADRERTLHAEKLTVARKLKRTATRNGTGGSRSVASSGSLGESRNPHPSHSHGRSPARQAHPSPGSATADGHLVRLLDERAAAQATTPPSRRDMGVSHSSSTESTAQHQYYKHHAPQYPGNGKHPPPDPRRRDLPPRDLPPVQTGRGGGGVPSAHSVSATSTYTSRGPAADGGGDYSLDQYSHDGSDTSSGRYSECSSQYSNPREETPRPIIEPPPGAPPGVHPHHSWRTSSSHHEYGKNLQYVNESYGEQLPDE